MEYFKGDDVERRWELALRGAFQSVSIALDETYDGIFGSVPLGAFLYDENRVPLTKAIKREIFIRCFKEVFEAWAFSGTFESYILVFKKIFGDDCEIEFTVPGAGQLEIDITAAGTQLDMLGGREIVDNEYVLSEIGDQDGDNIGGQSVLGFESEAELETMLFTMVPNGIFTTVSLTLGSEEE